MVSLQDFPGFGEDADIHYHRLQLRKHNLPFLILVSGTPFPVGLQEDWP
jgi:hypothetical protein